MPHLNNEEINIGELEQTIAKYKKGLLNSLIPNSAKEIFSKRIEELKLKLEELEVMIIEKMKADITERSIRKNFMPMGNARTNSHEFEYRYCYNSDYPEFYFVISKKIIFNGNSISNFTYMVYKYDKLGNFIDIPDMPVGFFSNIKDIAQSQ